MEAKAQLSRLDIETLPNYRKKTAKEWSSTCPFCGGVDRFLYWPEVGNYYCRQCEAQGFVLETRQTTITKEQREAWRLAEIERKQRELEERISAIERLQKSANKVEWYHGQVDRAMDYWQGQGLTRSTVDRYRLGFCEICPTEPTTASYTIPYYQNKSLVNLRHRLKCPNGHGKYRPEFAGLGNQLFNTDRLTAGPDEFSFLMEPGEIILVEGEIKTMYLDQMGFNAVGIPGANSWQDEWGNRFTGLKKVFVTLDPGADGHAWRVGSNLRERGLKVVVVTLPQKPDDMFTKYGASIGDFAQLLRQGRVVR